MKKKTWLHRCSQGCVLDMIEYDLGQLFDIEKHDRRTCPECGKMRDFMPIQPGQSLPGTMGPRIHKEGRLRKKGGDKGGHRKRN